MRRENEGEARFVAAALARNVSNFGQRKTNWLSAIFKRLFLCCFVPEMAIPKLKRKRRATIQQCYFWITDFINRNISIRWTKMISLLLENQEMNVLRRLLFFGHLVREFKAVPLVPSRRAGRGSWGRCTWVRSRRAEPMQRTGTSRSRPKPPGRSRMRWWWPAPELVLAMERPRQRPACRRARTVGGTKQNQKLATDFAVNCGCYSRI